MAQAHFNWLLEVPGVTHENLHVATGLAVGSLLIAAAVGGRVALGTGETAVMPASTFSLKGVMELNLEFIVGMADMVIGEEGHKFVPMFTAVFFFVLCHNFVGLIPGMTPATDNINTTLALGLFSFAAYNYYGLKEHGMAYLK